MPEATWTDYYYGKEYYGGYPKTTMNNNYKVIVRKRGGQEKEYNLKNQLQGDYYFSLKKTITGEFVEAEPSIVGNIFSAECRKIDRTGESYILLKIDIDNGKVISEEAKTK